MLLTWIFFSLVLKEILTLHCWIWWEDNSFQIPEGGFIVRYCLLKMLFAGTQNVEAERANNLWLSWITFCTDGTFLYTCCTVYQPVCSAHWDACLRKKTREVEVIVWWVFYYFFLECVFVYWSFAFACQSLTMGVVLFSSQVIVSAGYDKIFFICNDMLSEFENYTKGWHVQHIVDSWCYIFYTVFF